MKENGIWFSKSQSEVSYPEEGNELCSTIEDNSYWFQHRNNCISEVVRSFPPSGAVFDIGGGNGFVSMALQAMGLDVVLVEPGIIGARNAKARGVDSVICSTLENAGFHKNSLPSIGLFDVIEHIDEDEIFLHTIRNFMVGKGKVYITVPAYNFLWSSEDDVAGHYRRYTKSDLKHKLAMAGFTTIYSSYFFSFFVIPIFLLRTLPSRLMLRKAVILEQVKKEHSLPPGMIGALLNRVFQKEISLIRRQKSVPFGGSCLVVAEAT